MGNEQIAIYLNDHLAGSVAALGLLEHMEAAHVGTALEDFFAALRDDVTADRQELEALMSRLQVAQSHTRKATAWFAEKITELKLQVDDPEDGALRLLEGIEVLSLGIEGKKAMWRALEAAAQDTPASELALVDYELLVKRAEEQRRRVEVVRMEAAKKALFPAGS